MLNEWMSKCASVVERVELKARSAADINGLVEWLALLVCSGADCSTLPLNEQLLMAVPMRRVACGALQARRGAAARRSDMARLALKCYWLLTRRARAPLAQLAISLIRLRCWRRSSRRAAPSAALAAAYLSQWPHWRSHYVFDDYRTDSETYMFLEFDVLENDNDSNDNDDNDSDDSDDDSDDDDDDDGMFVGKAKLSQPIEALLEQEWRHADAVRARGVGGDSFGRFDVKGVFRARKQSVWFIKIYRNQTWSFRGRLYNVGFFGRWSPTARCNKH
jgi:hypothetical protein